MKFDISKSPYGPKDEIGRLNEITLNRVNGR